MRNLKRFLSLALVMLMVVGCFQFSASAKDFKDVTDYKTAIDVLSDIGVVVGAADDEFKPDEPVERWHMALFMSRLTTGLVGADNDSVKWRGDVNYTPFADVIADQYFGAINHAYNEGIILGTSATTYEPTAGITLQDALTMAVRALGYGSKEMDAGYPWKYINKANALGLANGISNLVAYTDALTRAETAQIVYNTLFAVRNDGKTFAKAAFNLTTVVIIADENYAIDHVAEGTVKHNWVTIMPSS